MMILRTWVGVKEAAQATGRKESAIYEQIRTGSFPFVYRQERKGAAIYISANDLGLIPPPESRDDDPSTELQSASA